MLTVLSAIWSRFGVWISAAGAVLVAIFAALSVGKAKGKASAAQESANDQIKTNEAIAVRQINEANEGAKVRVEAAKGAADETAKVNQLNSGAIAGELRDEWTRPE